MSRSASDVTIVTVNWNGGHHLAQLLPSLEELGAAQIMVVDNGSSDGSVEMLRRDFPRVQVLQNEANRGFAQPNNWAARQATTPLLAFINNDMRADGAWLRRAVPLLKNEVACVASRILDWEGRRIDYNGSSLQYLGYALQKDLGELVDKVSHQDRVLFACGGAMLVDRQLFIDLGGFDEAFFAIFEDVDFGWRVWLSGYEVAFAPQSQVFHRGHGTFAAHENAKMRYLMHRNALATILKNYEEETFQRVFPLAVLLTIRRAVGCSGVHKKSFYLWEEAQAQVKASDLAARQQWLDALNHLVALDDVLENLPDWLERRRQVQELRKRPDSEILALFEDPFRSIVEDPGYSFSESACLQLTGLTSLFGVKAKEELWRGFPEQLRREIGSLKRSWQLSSTGERRPCCDPRLEDRCLPGNEPCDCGETRAGVRCGVDSRRARCVDFSVIIPTFNRSAILVRTLQALACQKQPPAFEVLVVDDGSSDDTAQQMYRLQDAYPAPLHYYYQPNRKQGAARNLGARFARGRTLLFLGDDIVPTAGFLAQHQAARRQESRSQDLDRLVVIGYTTWPPYFQQTRLLDYVGEKGWQFGFSLIKDATNVPFNYFYTSNLSIQRSFFISSGGFDEDFQDYGWEDIELGFRLHQLGMRIVFRREATAHHHHRISLGSFLKRQQQVGYSAWNFYRKQPALGDFLGIEQARHYSLLDHLRLRLLAGACRFCEKRSWPDLSRYYPDVLSYYYLLGLERARSGQS